MIVNKFMPKHLTSVESRVSEKRDLSKALRGLLSNVY